MSRLPPLKLIGVWILINKFLSFDVDLVGGLYRPIPGPYWWFIDEIQLLRMKDLGRGEEGKVFVYATNLLYNPCIVQGDHRLWTRWDGEFCRGDA